jgi:hypothetical protein
MKITIEGGVYIDNASTESERYVFFAGKFGTWGQYVAVAPHTIEVETDADIRQQQVDALEAKKRELAGQYQAAVTLIDGRIANLLALTHEPPT